MNDKQKLDLFRRQIERAFSTFKERIDDQVDFNHKYDKAFKEEYVDARNIVFSAKEAPFLQELMKTYLILYERYQSNRNNVRFYKSDQLFQLMIEQSAKVSDPSLFETWVAYLKDTSVLVSFRDRFAALDPNIQSVIKVFIERERERRRSQRSLIDVLRTEYARTHGGKMPTAVELEEFDPRPSFRGLADNHIRTVHQRFLDAQAKPTDENLDRFAKQLQNFSGWLKTVGDDDLLRVFQVFKLVRDPPFEMNVHLRALYYGLHAIACIQLHAAALRKHKFARNLDGLTPDEVTFFVEPVSRSNFLYRSNIVRALSGSLRDHAMAIAQIALFVNTYLMAESRYKGKLSLLNLEETLSIQKKWADVRELSQQIGFAAKQKDLAALTRVLRDPRNAAAVKSLREFESRTIQVSSGHVLGTRVLKAGSRIKGHPKLGTIAVAYIDRGQVVHVEFGPFKPQLFQASHAFIANRQFAESILEIHNSTVGMVHLTRLMFTAMGFMPALVSGGFVGLMYEVASFLAIDWLQEKVAEIDPTLAAALGLALSLFGPRSPTHPKLKTDMVHPPADRTGLSGVLNPTARKADGAIDAANSRADAVANKVVPPPIRRPDPEPPAVRKPDPEPPAVRKPDTEPPPVPAAPARTPPPTSQDTLVARQIWAESRLGTRRPANEPDVNLPQSARAEQPAVAQAAGGMRGRTMATPESPTGGTVTYEPSAARSPNRADTRFTQKQNALEGRVSSAGTSSGAARGMNTGSRATPTTKSYGRREIELPARRGDGLDPQMRNYIKRAATIYREEMSAQNTALPIWEQSTNAHVNTLRRMRKEFPDVTEHGQPYSGVTGPGLKGNVRIADVTHADLSSPARKFTPADFHIELKLKAYAENEGKVLRVSGERNPKEPKVEATDAPKSAKSEAPKSGKAESSKPAEPEAPTERITAEQIQAYEAYQEAFGVPTFVINARGEIYAYNKRGRWIKVGGPE